MQQTQTMTLDEKFAIGKKVIELEKQGKTEEAEKMHREMIPMPPYMAKWAKDHLGADWLIEGGWNLSEANAEYGDDWLTR
ncbi:MAG: hypothetical protein LBU00_04645 [Treponema sp.]|jgi:hypothetical protein|nr:hypothetical protein [Treponema sp.]